jgi:hypothetical protein
MMMMSQSNACPSPLHTALRSMRKYFVQKKSPKRISKRSSVLKVRGSFIMPKALK